MRKTTLLSVLSTISATLATLTLAACARCGAPSTTSTASTSTTTTSTATTTTTVPACAPVGGQWGGPGGANSDVPAALRAACAADSWPAEVITCMSAVRDEDGVTACAAALDDARADWLTYRVGMAAHHTPGFGCDELEHVLREARACPRVANPADDPTTEMQLALTEARTQLGADEGKRRMSELRCISLQRLARQHILAHPCAP